MEEREVVSTAIHRECNVNNVPICIFYMIKYMLMAYAIITLEL